MDTLAATHAALTGEAWSGLPILEPVADLTRPGMVALFGTTRLVRRRLQQRAEPIDLLLPLLQEIIACQLHSAWPKRIAATGARPADLASRHLRLAIAHIEANLAAAPTLADIAAAVGTSVRSLQGKLDKELGRTPVQFIIERRLSRVHDDLISVTTAERPIAEIARHHGFVHERLLAALSPPVRPSSLGNAAAGRAWREMRMSMRRRLADPAHGFRSAAIAAMPRSKSRKAAIWSGLGLGPLR